jgi:hypothetical protein
VVFDFDFGLLQIGVVRVRFVDLCLKGMYKNNSLRKVLKEAENVQKQFAA